MFGGQPGLARQQSDTILFQKPNSGRTSMNAMQAQAQQLRKPVNLDAFDPFSTNRSQSSDGVQLMQQKQQQQQQQQRQTSQSFDPFAQRFDNMTFDTPPKRHANAGQQDTSDFDVFFNNSGNNNSNLRTSKSMGNVDDFDMFGGSSQHNNNNNNNSNNNSKEIPSIKNQVQLV